MNIHYISCIAMQARIEQLATYIQKKKYHPCGQWIMVNDDKYVYFAMYFGTYPLNSQHVKLCKSIWLKIL